MEKERRVLCPFCNNKTLTKFEPPQIVQTAQKALDIGIFGFYGSGAASAALLLFCFGYARGCKNGCSNQPLRLLRRRLSVCGDRCTLFFRIEKKISAIALSYGFPCLDIESVMPYC